MPNDIAIRVENLGKMYHIGREVKRAANAREAIQRIAMAPFRYTKDMIRHHQYMKQLIRDSEFVIRDCESPEPRTPNQEPRITNPEPRTPNPERYK